MAKNVFISFLGAGNYSTCTYRFNDFNFETRFIQEATIKYLLSKESLSSADVVVTLLTEKATSKNWSGPDGLEGKLKKLPVPLKTVAIPDGNSDEEIWEIFGKLIDSVSERDNLYIDVTHAFRFLPMLLLVFSDFVKLTKGISVKSISYGNWEAKTNDNVAPVIDLLPLAKLQSWTNATSQFLDSGSIKRVVALSEENYRPLLKITNGKDLEARNMSSFVQKLDEHINNILTCQGRKIIDNKEIIGVRDICDDFSNNTSNPYTHIYSLIIDSFKSFLNEKSPINLLTAARWCFDKELYQLSATYAEEFVNVFFAKLFNLDPYSNDCQGLLNGAFDYAAQILSKKEVKSSGSLILVGEKEYSIETANIGEQILKNYEKLVNKFTDFKERVRNYLNHAGIRPDLLKNSTIIKKLRVFLESLQDFIISCETKEDIKGATTFINISNHPYSKWQKKQVEQAMVFGKVMEIPFPSVNPAFSEADINNMADEIVKKVFPAFNPEITTLHIMGEMNLTYSLVNHFKALGYKCVASTSERNVIEGDNGEKTVLFDFVCFREY